MDFLSSSVIAFILPFKGNQDRDSVTFQGQDSETSLIFEPLSSGKGKKGETIRRAFLSPCHHLIVLYHTIFSGIYPPFDEW